jgi:hypothetical protein
MAMMELRIKPVPSLFRRAIYAFDQAVKSIGFTVIIR